ncbi:MAG TPA: hypothetical protein PLR25_28035 [Planctomycetaceae bacterium]|nr:hypothetical protein [Planctomycetaceae bacterium]
MSWLTENPWPLLLILVGTAVVAMISGAPKGRSVAIACVLAAVGLYVLESAVVTPAEQVEGQLQTMLDGFRDRNQASIDACIADESPGLKETAQKGLDLVTLTKDFHIKDLEVKLREDNQTADAHLRANGTLKLNRSDMVTRVFTRWQTVWKLEGGDWKLVEVRRLDPVNGQEIGILDKR